MWNDEEGYAGTLDGVWQIDGRMCLLDIKTSRGLYSSTWMQLAALRAAPEAFIPKDDDSYISLRDWQAPVEGAGVIHIRPRDTTHSGKPMPAFCKWVELEDEELHLQSFLGLLQYQHAQRAVRTAVREREKNGNNTSDS